MSSDNISDAALDRRPCEAAAWSAVTSSVFTLESMLASVHSIADEIQRTEIAVIDKDTTAWALDRCRRIRDAPTVADAALAGIQLGERLAELRGLGVLAKRAIAHPSKADSAHAKVAERRKVYLAYRNRGFSTVKAYERAAAQLRVSTKTIARAVRGH
jgi:hypothetical protein